MTATIKMVRVKQTLPASALNNLKCIDYFNYEKHAFCIYAFPVVEELKQPSSLLHHNTRASFTGDILTYCSKKSTGVNKTMSDG